MKGRRLPLGLSSKTVFPYPVVSPYNEDFSGASIEFLIEADLRHDVTSQVKLEYRFIVNCPDIVKLIESGHARVGCLMHCMDTFHTRVIQLEHGNSRYFSVDVDEVFDTVYLQPIVWTVRSCSWSPEHVNDEFRDAVPFDLPAGSLLGFGQVWRVELNGIGQVSEAIFQLDSSSTFTEGMAEVDVDGDRITIKLGQKTFRQVNLLRGWGDRGLVILMNGLYLPAIMEVLDRMRSGEEYEYKWYRVFRKRLRELGIDLNDGTSLHEVAQKILDKPMRNFQIFIEEQKDV